MVDGTFRLFWPAGLHASTLSRRLPHEESRVRIVSNAPKVADRRRSRASRRRIGLAWNRAGHMVTGAIAYDDLQKTSPATVARVVAILRQHPQYESRWKPQMEGMSEQDQERYLFMLAARWPDDIRGDKAFDHPTWHYIDYLYRPSGQPASLPGPPPAAEDIVESVSAERRDRAERAPDAQKAVALCWIFHLMGDAHQPLHAVALVHHAIPHGGSGRKPVLHPARSIERYDPEPALLLGQHRADGRALRCGSGTRHGA